MTERAAQRSLLVLGSNVDAEQQLGEALRALAELGQVTATSPRIASADVAGSGLIYLNQLVELAADCDALVAPLKAIERAQGRSPARMLQGLCDLDIDLLARIDEDGRPTWLADKPRQIPAVAELLRAWFAGVQD